MDRRYVGAVRDFMKLYLYSYYGNIDVAENKIVEAARVVDKVNLRREYNNVSECKSSIWRL
ncbi:MAG: hypothetical protein GY679_01235 [Mycoplasma sp.]|nr:hypothetical protein [Mycoplasma sp.]